MRQRDRERQREIEEEVKGDGDRDTAIDRIIRIRIIIYWIVTSNHSDLHTIRYDKFEFKIIHSTSTFDETPVVLLLSLIGIIMELIQHLG